MTAGRDFLFGTRFTGGLLKFAGLRSGLTDEQPSLFISPDQSVSSPIKPLIAETDSDIVADQENDEKDHDLQIRFGIPSGTEVAPGWFIVDRLPLILEFDDGTSIVSDELFGRYGIGETVNEARADFIDDLINYYQILAEDADEEHPATLALLEYLQHYIRPT